MRAAVLLCAAVCCAQDFSQRGFLETGFITYPQTAPNDSGRAVGEALLRYEAFYKKGHWQFSGGIDARGDSHRQVERVFHLSWWDRETLRPAFEMRRLSAAYTRGRATLEVGKQLIRWGKADILNPTDRFAPRDFLDVVENDFLAVPAARLTYGGASNSIELVWQPRFTPSRVPLLNQRWAIVPEGLPLVDRGARYPGGSQAGARWNHIGRAGEYSLSFYDGRNHLPLIGATLDGPHFAVQRFYPRMRMFGADGALLLPAVTLKAEAACFKTDRDRPAAAQADEYLLYVIQLERQAGEWFFVGGYAGQVVTEHGSNPGFAPDRGLTRAFVGRAGYTIDTNRSVAAEAAIRQNGKGIWLKLEYTQAIGAHWRATAVMGLIRGSAGDFLGQYHRNSHAMVKLKYSF